MAETSYPPRQRRLSPSLCLRLSLSLGAILSISFSSDTVTARAQTQAQASSPKAATAPAASTAASGRSHTTTPDTQGTPAAQEQGDTKVHVAKHGHASPQFAVAGPVSSTLQRVTGITWLSEVIANQVAKHQIQKRLGGKAKVSVRTYSFTDLLAGKVKSVKVRMKGSNIKNIPLGEVNLSTDNPFWYDYHRRDGHVAGLRNPLMIGITGHLNQEDISTALKSPKVTQQLRGLKLDLPGLGEQQLQVVHPKVRLEKGLINIDALLITAGAAPDTGVPIKICGRPELEGDKIVLKDMKVNSPYIVEPEQFAAFAEELLNPIVNFSRLDRKDHAFRLKNLAVLNDSVDGSGQLLLVPRQKAK